MTWAARCSTALLVALAAGCATDPGAQEFRPYLEAFAAEARLRGHAQDVSRVHVDFGRPFPAAAVASCYAAPLGVRHIAVNRTVWAGIDANCREIFVFHELGHCLLDRAHVNETHADGTPVSLMNFDTVPCALYRGMRARYLDELFAPAP